MDDEMLVSLYWARDENAIVETSSKYGRLCKHIANNILASHEDREECINDTYFAVWNSIPDKHPNRFSVFICRIVRNLALKKYEYISAAKRNPSAVTSLEELGDCVSGTDSIESEVEKNISKIRLTDSSGSWMKKNEMYLYVGIGILIQSKLSVCIRGSVKAR